MKFIKKLLINKTSKNHLILNKNENKLLLRTHYQQMIVLIFKNYIKNIKKKKTKIQQKKIMR